MKRGPLVEETLEEESVRIKEAMAAGETEWSSASSEETLREDEDESWQGRSVVVFEAVAIVKDSQAHQIHRRIALFHNLLTYSASLYLSSLSLAETRKLQKEGEITS